MMALTAGFSPRRIRGAIRQNPLVSIAVTLLAGFAAIVVLHPILMPFGPTAADATRFIGGPSFRHPMGTDSMGLDILSRVLHGSRYAVAVPVGAALLSLAIGLPLGLIAGLRGGRFDRLLHRLAQAIAMFPALLLALALVAAMGRSFLYAAIAIGVLDAALVARALRAEVAALRQRGFIEAGIAAGMSRARLIVVHVLPNSLPWLLCEVPRRVAVALGTLSAMGFVGLVGASDSTEWGAMIRRGMEDLLGGQWWAAVFPGLALLLVAFAWHLLGAGLSDLRRASAAEAAERIIGADA